MFSHLESVYCNRVTHTPIRIAMLKLKRVPIKTYSVLQESLSLLYLSIDFAAIIKPIAVYCPTSIVMYVNSRSIEPIQRPAFSRSVLLSLKIGIIYLLYWLKDDRHTLIATLAGLKHNRKPITVTICSMEKSLIYSGVHGFCVQYR